MDTSKTEQVSSCRHPGRRSWYRAICGRDALDVISITQYHSQCQATCLTHSDTRRQLFPCHHAEQKLACPVTAGHFTCPCADAALQFCQPSLCGRWGDRQKQNVLPAKHCGEVVSQLLTLPARQPRITGQGNSNATNIAYKRLRQGSVSQKLRPSRRCIAGRACLIGTRDSTDMAQMADRDTVGPDSLSRSYARFW